MLKRITFIIVLLVFAKPAYDLITPYLTSSVIEDSLIESVPSKPITQQNVIVTSGEETASEASELPNKARSLQELTDAFYYHFSRYEEEFTIHYAGSTENISELVEKATQAAIRIDPFIEGHLSKRETSYTYSKTSAVINVQQSYLITADQAGSVAVTVEDILERNNVYALSDFEKIKFVNDYIVKNTVYSTETTTSPHSAYTVLAEGKAVCQGYALLAQMMFAKLGIESLYVVGEAGGIGHAWNLVNLDGKWYHVDTTWNDPSPDRGPDFARYAYFLMSDRQLEKDHIWNKGDYPAARDDQYAFMHVIADNVDVGPFIYFSNESDNSHLYRLDKETRQVEKLLDTRVQFLTGDGDHLYYSDYSRGGYLTELQLSTMEERVLIRKHVKNLFMHEGFLYFSSDDGNEKIPL